MIGHLTIDKASMNISYFLYSLKLINSHNGAISREDFSKEMGIFVGIPYEKDGKENRTPYNKSKLPRYFGFVGLKEENKKDFLVLTNRGKRILSLIKEEADKENEERFSIKPEKKNEFIETIIESVVFDSFGKNNCGAENSNTDIEPPKVLFKMLVDLKKITAEEFCFVLFGLNNLKLNSYDDAINLIKANRAKGKYTYKNELDNMNVLNIAKDCKLINLFKNPSIELLKATKDSTSGKIFYSLSDNVTESNIIKFKKISYFYKPTRNLFYSEGNSKIINWINQTILGKEYDSKYIIELGLTKNNIGTLTNGKFEPGLIEKGMLLSLSNIKKNVYFIYKFKTNEDIQKIFGKYSALIKTIQDFKSNYNGWSKNLITDNVVYNYLCSQNRNIKKILVSGKIRFASNIHLIGVCENYGR